MDDFEVADFEAADFAVGVDVVVAGGWFYAYLASRRARVDEEEYFVL